MSTMHTSPAPLVPDRIPSQESTYRLNGFMPLPPSWAILCHQSQENTSRNGSCTMQFMISLKFGSPGTPLMMMTLDCLKNMQKVMGLLPIS